MGDGFIMEEKGEIKSMKQMERIAGFILLAIVILFGMFGLSSSMLYFRLMMGAILGYALARGFMGFAGSVNRAYKGGSTKLMRALMFMFFVSAAVSTAVLYNADVSQFDLRRSSLRIWYGVCVMLCIRCTNRLSCGIS